jgi:hypothetical protein
MNRFMYFIILFIIGFFTSFLFAQMDMLHGDDNETRMGVHAGNKFRTSFFNDGTFGGRVNQPPEIAGEWPINSGHYYLVDGNIFVGSEVVDTTGNLIHILSENKSANIGGSRGDQGPNGEWWTFLPLPGFANPTGDRIAMARGSSEWENSWPARWPDIGDPNNPYGIYSADAWAGSWNGYFGRDVFNADEESYFVADDYMNREFSFFPDSTDLDRKGLGVRIYVRGFQWAKAAVEDALFCLFDIENIGTHFHDKMIFAYKIGNNMGESNDGSDAGDDNASFRRDLDLAYMWDNDDLGAGNWSPVGYMGGAFLESPGNPFDGIDNDNDGYDPIIGVPGTGSGPEITSALWAGPKTLNLNDDIVLIDYSSPTYERTVTTLGDALQAAGKGPNDTLEVHYLGRIFKFWAGQVLDLNDDHDSEIGDNLVDDNLNGIIDENRGQEDDQGIFRYLYEGYRYIDYFTGNGENNPLIDERRDDNIDNDGDWDSETDDVGADGIGPGIPGYPGPDFGEGDGIPTAGEPHFDKTDIDESDQLGLTSFNLYEWTSLNQFDDEAYWQAMAPGFFSSNVTGQNVELLFGSGYFPLPPDRVERFSMAILCGDDLDDLIRNKGYVAQAYNENYNFSKAPNIPTVRAVVGDKKVTLFWDSYAEQSVDPITGNDFEGYRIYRSTDPSFNDAKPITDAYGSVIFREPMEQFDLDNDVYGFASAATQGVFFYLGDDTGLRHFWTDTTVVNGYTYYYAVTSYDRGSTPPAGFADTLGIDPSECSKFVAVQSTGEVEKGTNVVIAEPEAPSAGFTKADFEGSQILSGANNTAEGNVSYSIVDPTQVKNDHTYQITFKETLSDQLLDSTASFTLVDSTTNDTLLEDYSLGGDEHEGLPITDGFQLLFSNNPIELNLNTDLSGWSRPGIPEYDFRRYAPVPGSRPIDLIYGDFKIIFGTVGVDTSKLYYIGNNNVELPPIPVNFTVINTSTNTKVDFAFRDRIIATPEDSGKFTFDLTRRRSDEIIFLADPDSLVASWQIVYLISSPSQPDTLVPGPGDTLTIKLDKPFLSHDTYSFTTHAPGVSKELAKSDLDKIRVVPNPYIVTNSWEPHNPYSSGRGDRQLHFTHLPAKCTIRIFNVRGQLIETIPYESTTSDGRDGTYRWDMLSKDNLEISYGIYIYHVEAEGIGEKIGKFVVVK